MGSEKIYHWELELGEENVSLGMDWSVIVNETVLSIEIAERDGGISYNLEIRAAVQRSSRSCPHRWGRPGQLPETLRAFILLIQEQKTAQSASGE